MLEQNFEIHDYCTPLKAIGAPDVTLKDILNS